MAAAAEPELRPVVYQTVRSIVFLAIALLAILVLLPAALMAAGP